MTERVFAWPCPNPFACLGGTNLGNGSCATGHAGLLCGFCAEGFYRKRTGCDSCISGSSTAGPMIVWILTFFVLIAIVAGSIIYMYRGARLDLAPAQREAPMNQRADQLQKKTQFDRFFAIVSLLPKKLVAASTIFRIFFGYVQCLTIVLRFTNVVWPPGFVSFVKVLEYFTIDIFTMLPIACLTGNRLTFTTELMIICMLPIMSVLILSVVTLVVAPLAGHSHSCRGFEHVLNGLIHRAELWDLVLFFFLFEYPIVARKSVSTFDCLDLGYGDDVAPSPSIMRRCPRQRVRLPCRRHSPPPPRRSFDTRGRHRLGLLRRRVDELRPNRAAGHRALLLRVSLCHLDCRPHGPLGHCGASPPRAHAHVDLQ